MRTIFSKSQWGVKRVSKELACCIVLVFVALFVHGCYIPNNFSMDLQIAPDGRFALRYEGDLIENNLANPNNDGQDRNPDDYVKNLKRYSGFENIDYKGGGIFSVAFTQRGNIRKMVTYSFIDQNNRFISLVNSNPSEIVIQGNLMPDSLKKSVPTLNGVARVWTNAHVIYNNADRVIDGPLRRYEWDISVGRTTVPKMIISTRSN